jgi:transcriptional regulator with XRE-family HTH domain
MRKKNPVLIQLGQNIVSVRKSRKWSQEDLALEADIDRTYVGGIERGERNVAVINLCKIAKTLQVKPSKLLKGLELIGDKNSD